MVKLLIVEDDIFLREELQNIFQKKGYSAGSISSFDTPIDEILSYQPDLIILDLNLPGQSGFEICRELKAKGIGPILVLTSRNQLQDELHALDLGADDYLTKPCHPERLLARVEKLIHLYGKMRVLLDAGEFQLDEKTYELIYREGSLFLPENEGKILRCLIVNAPKLVTKDILFQELWGSQEYVDENILQVNMTRLRKDLDKICLGDLIKTVRGEGYRLKVGEENEE